jgi:uncharacterized protein (DUF1810 family)
MTLDPFNLQRFVEAQAGVIDAVRRELRAGQKSSHWMWFVFPQLAGLGLSPTAQFFGIESHEEARAYLAHPLLGGRLRECAEIVNAIEGRNLQAIFGDPDRLKFRSCMTLFALASPEEQVFSEALRKYCDGQGDPRTTALLQASLADRQKSG